MGQYLFMGFDPRPTNGHVVDVPAKELLVISHRWLAAGFLLVAACSLLLRIGCNVLASYCMLLVVGGLLSGRWKTPNTSGKGTGDYHLPLGAKTTMLLVAVQTGMQPYIYRECTRGAHLLKSEFVISYNLQKLCMTVGLIVASGSFSAAVKTAVTNGLRVAFPPAGVYAVQNMLTAVAFASISGLAYNLLNQTKIIWTALCVWLLLGRRVRPLQWMAIALLCISGALIVLDEASAKGQSKELGDALVSTRLFGSIAALVSAFCSGLTSALSERALHLHSRPSLVFSTELAIFELVTILLILTVESGSGWEMTGDLPSIHEYGLFGRATALSLVPCSTQAVGGILVGHLTKVTDGVSKCYVLIVAVMLSAVARVLVDKAPLTYFLMMALPLGLMSIWLNFGVGAKKKTT